MIDIIKEKVHLKNAPLDYKLKRIKELNSKFNSQSKKIKLLHKLFKNNKAVIISCGPSLNKQNFDKIKKLSEDHVIISVKQAFNLFKDITDFHIFNCANVVKYDYSEFRPVVVEASSFFNEINNSDIAFRIIERNFNNSLAVQKNLDEWKIVRNDKIRPYGPGIMYELAFFLVEHLGFLEVLTIGWDNKLVNKSAENQHFYKEENLEIFNDVSKVEGIFKNLEFEEKVTIGAIPTWHNWLKENGCTLKICSSLNPAPPEVERVVL